MNILRRSSFLLLSIALLLSICLQTSASEAVADQSYATDQQQTYIPAVTTSQKLDGGITIAQLDNGMTLIVEENHTVAATSVLVRVKAGGIYEDKWLGCGLSHLLEHLVAKGATRGAGHVESDKESRSRIDAIGAQSNAYTSMDNTTYYISCASNRSNEAIDILTDWIARPGLTVEEFEREHGVVQRELEMGMDNTRRLMWKLHSSNFYVDHPASVPIIGWADALAGVKYEDVVNYHKKMYTPARMVFVVVGDVDTNETIEQICNGFRGFKSQRSRPVILPEVPQVSSPRRRVFNTHLTKDVKEYMTFRSIPLVHDDLYALDVLACVLGQGQTSRLYSSLVREKSLVTSVSSSSWTPAWGAGQFMINFTCEPGKQSAAEAEILAQLEKIITGGISEAELDRAKTVMKANFVYSRQDVHSRADTYASDYMTSGDVNFSRLYTQRISKVTAADVQKMAQKYIDFDAMVITRMTPEAADDADKNNQETKTKLDAKIFTLDNGLKVILQPVTTVELTSATLAVTGGVLAETPENNGIGALMTKLSTKGTASMSAEQIASFFENAGGAVTTTCGNNTFVWQLDVLSDKTQQAMDIFADIVTEPTFAEDELELLRPQILSAIRATGERSTSQMMKFFREKFFVNTPWAMQTIGSESAVEKITAEDIKAHYSKWIKSGSAVLSVYGNFDTAKIEKLIKEKLSKLPAGKSELAEYSPRKIAANGESYTLKTKYKQATVLIGWPGMKIDNQKDRDAITILDTLLSGYRLPSGPLHKRLRGKQLVYMVHAYNWTGLVPGTFLAMATTQPDKAQQVTQIILETVGESLDTLYTPEEIDQAINTILTADLLDSQALSDLSMQATLDELYGMGYDYSKSLPQRLKAVSAEDIRSVARKYLSVNPVITITTPSTSEPAENKEYNE